MRRDQRFAAGSKPGGTRALVPEKRGGSGHVGADSNRPHRKLVPRQQVSRKSQKEGQQKEEHSHHPVELARRAITTREKHAEHVQHYDDDHRVRAPAVNFAKHPKSHNVTQFQHVAIGVRSRGTVIQHEQHAGDRLHKHQEEGDPAETPGVTDSDGMPRNRHRVQMKHKVRQHHSRSGSAILRGGMPNDAAIKLGSAYSLS